MPGSSLFVIRDVGLIYPPTFKWYAGAVACRAPSVLVASPNAAPPARTALCIRHHTCFQFYTDDYCTFLENCYNGHNASISKDVLFLAVGKQKSKYLSYRARTYCRRRCKKRHSTERSECRFHDS